MALIKLADMKGLREDGYIKWQCPTSPSGCCEYDDEKDPAWDQCLHCGDPYERK